MRKQRNSGTGRELERSEGAGSHQTLRPLEGGGILFCFCFCSANVLFPKPKAPGAMRRPKGKGAYHTGAAT